MTRREIRLETLLEAKAESRKLLEAGYVRNGNWTLGQACQHLRVTIDASMDGYPRWMSLAAPIRPLLRWLLLPKLMRGDSLAGLKTAKIFVPPDNLNDKTEVDAFAQCIERFSNHQGKLYPHPGFGRFDHQTFGKFHAAHAAHHFSFLSYAATQD